MQNRNAARRPIRIVDRVNDIGAGNLRVLNPVAKRTRNRQRVKVQKIFLRKFVHDGVNPARLVKVLHMVLACGAELCNIRRPRRNFIKQRRGDFNSAFVGNRRQMQNGIRRAANPHVNGYGVFKSLHRQNITRANIFL